MYIIVDRKNQNIRFMRYMYRLVYAEHQLNRKYLDTTFIVRNGFWKRNKYTGIFT